MLAFLLNPDWLIAALLVVLLFMMLGIHGRLLRIEDRLSRGSRAAMPDGADGSSKSSAESGIGPFEEFLAEDPQRLLMPKSDQFAAYREWRRERGMNWTDSSS